MVWFIDKKGEKHFNNEISSHIGLALFDIFEKNPELKKEFDESGEKDASIFLLKIKGWMLGDDERRKVVYNSSTLSDEQKRLLYGFIEEGYKDEDRHDISEETER